MIISQVIGGLGNQMFQYAAGRSLALSRDSALALDVSGFDNYAMHQGFELRRVFDAPFATASAADVNRVLGWRRSALVRRALARLPAAIAGGGAFAQEPHFHYWPGFVTLPADVYLSGYWQSERYFGSHAAQIRADFSFAPPTGRNAELAAQIAVASSVSLHVRRGDYASNPKATATHGLCSLDYYRAAIAHVAQRVENPVFFVFSDDIAWVRANLPIGFAHHFVEHNQGAESYNDMRLMSLCRHHVIANSSFSWWGAWLNPSREKIVAAPRGWFANGNDTSDLFPEGWALL